MQELEQWDEGRPTSSAVADVSDADQRDGVITYRQRSARMVPPPGVQVEDEG